MTTRNQVIQTAAKKLYIYQIRNIKEDIGWGHPKLEEILTELGRVNGYDVKGLSDKQYKSLANAVILKSSKL